ncbi:hypothetical protein CONLIGDRAFT_431930 [Coniochaeta ligniaria NRRL 30616]|uniref:Uncharacterized protein n=1 Tax=Coniochaeta ligniaria NRRL 30616 TaxID=1408157 RepID=A0A1J7IJC3_9PEZI|nr:hypothetical protein CONLIGDRAFT_431930 [Coniochaeta ligniaria NRRL 30616]
MPTGGRWYQGDTGSHEQHCGPDSLVRFSIVHCRMWGIDCLANTASTNRTVGWSGSGSNRSGYISGLEVRLGPTKVPRLNAVQVLDHQVNPAQSPSAQHSSSLPDPHTFGPHFPLVYSSYLRFFSSILCSSPSSSSRLPLAKPHPRSASLPPGKRLPSS